MSGHSTHSAVSFFSLAVSISDHRDACLDYTSAAGFIGHFFMPGNVFIHADELMMSAKQRKLTNVNPCGCRFDYVVCYYESAQEAGFYTLTH